MINVLVIDDDEFSLKLAALILANAGHQVRTAESALKGISFALAQRPDIVLMDIEMEHLDGLAATRLLRTHPSTAGIRIVALTGHASTGMRAAIVDAGCDAYLGKPYSGASLLQAVEAVLPHPVAEHSSEPVQPREPAGHAANSLKYAGDALGAQSNR